MITVTFAVIKWMVISMTTILRYKIRLNSLATYKFKYCFNFINTKISNAMTLTEATPEFLNNTRSYVHCDKCVSIIYPPDDSFIIWSLLLAQQD